MGFLMFIFMAAFLIYHFTGGALGTADIFGPPKVLPPQRYDDVVVNVWYIQNKDIYFLGRTQGIIACKDAAYNYAEEHAGGQEWSYVCCTEEGDSHCDRSVKPG